MILETVKWNELSLGKMIKERDVEDASSKCKQPGLFKFIHYSQLIQFGHDVALPVVTMWRIVS